MLPFGHAGHDCHWLLQLLVCDRAHCVALGQPILDASPVIPVCARHMYNQQAAHFSNRELPSQTGSQQMGFSLNCLQTETCQWSLQGFHHCCQTHCTSCRCLTSQAKGTMKQVLANRNLFCLVGKVGMERRTSPRWRMSQGPAGL